MSSSRVWVVGGGRILATTDGGLHWTTQYQGTAVFTGVDFLNADDGWAVGPNGLFGTVDGRTWQSLRATHPGVLSAVDFVSPSLGWGIAHVTVGCRNAIPEEVGQVVESTDGGQDWYPAGPSGDAESVCFVTESEGWIGMGSGQLLHTTDGGVTWRQVFQLEPAIASPFPGDATVQCTGPHAVWAYFAPGGVAYGHSPFIAYQATDGTHFHAVLEEPYTLGGSHPGIPAGPGWYPGPFSVVSPSVAQFLGFSPGVNGYGETSLMTASDAGSSLSTTTAVPGINAASGASFASQEVGWVVGGLKSGPSSRLQSTYSILRTLDGGVTWRAQLTLTS